METLRGVTLPDLVLTREHARGFIVRSIAWRSSIKADVGVSVSASRAPYLIRARFAEGTGSNWSSQPHRWTDQWESARHALLIAALGEALSAADIPLEPEGATLDDGWGHEVEVGGLAAVRGSAGTEPTPAQVLEYATAKAYHGFLLGLPQVHFGFPDHLRVPAFPDGFVEALRSHADDRWALKPLQKTIERIVIVPSPAFARDYEAEHAPGEPTLPVMAARLLADSDQAGVLAAFNRATEALAQGPQHSATTAMQEALAALDLRVRELTTQPTLADGVDLLRKRKTITPEALRTLESVTTLPENPGRGKQAAARADRDAAHVVSTVAALLISLSHAKT